MNRYPTWLNALVLIILMTGIFIAANSISLDLATYRLELLNDTGEILESLLTIPGQASYRRLREVYQLAHRQASYSEKSIDEVLQHLRQT